MSCCCSNLYTTQISRRSGEVVEERIQLGSKWYNITLTFINPTTVHVRLVDPEGGITYRGSAFRSRSAYMGRREEFGSITIGGEWIDILFSPSDESPNHAYINVTDFTGGSFYAGRLTAEFSVNSNSLCCTV